MPMEPSEPAIPLVTSAVDLSRLAVELHNQKAIAVDLEADSMHNYREKVCLLQFSTPDRTVLVDPLAIPDLSPLRPVMADPTVRKIFHAADYDIRCLFRDFAIEVHGLFDTMVCCQFLGEEKVGLADVLAKYYDLRLAKQHQRSDWSMRPLPDEMIRYAATDTAHLLNLAEALEKKVIDKGRLDWVAEEFCLLEQVRHNPVRGPLFLRAKGAWSLNRRQLALLEGLLQWRESEAERRDCPPFKGIGNKELIDLARAAPPSINEMAEINGLPPRLFARYGRSMARVIEAALALPEEKLPVLPDTARHPKDPAADARLKSLKKWRTEKAAELDMEAGIVINNGLLEEIARQPPDEPTGFARFPAMKNWQRLELGQGILAALRQT